MNIITGEDRGHKSVSHSGEHTVRVYHVTLNTPTKAHYQCDWSFDFTDVTRKELEIIAARGLVIKYRNPFKNAPEKELEGLDIQSFNVRKFLDVAPQRLNPVQKAKKAVAGLTKEQVEELLAGM